MTELEAAVAAIEQAMEPLAGQTWHAPGLAELHDETHRTIGMFLDTEPVEEHERPVPSLEEGERFAAWCAACSPAAISLLLAALKAAQVDAGRYRWLRNDPPTELSVRRFPGMTERGCYLDGPDLDAAVDKALAAQPPEGEPQ